MRSKEGRAIAKRCYLCKASPSAVGKRGEATPRGSERGMLFEGLFLRLNLFALAVPVFRGDLFAFAVPVFVMRTFPSIPKFPFEIYTTDYDNQHEQDWPCRSKYEKGEDH